MRGDSKKELTNYITKSKATGQFAYFMTKEKGKKIYSLIYGVYTSYTKAEQDAKALPAKMLVRRPQIRKFENIQKSIKKQN